jgi:hypothetical protein
MNKTLEIIVRKLLKVIDSISSKDHILAVRRYIDLYYKLYGTENKGIIEIYFRTRKEKFI